MRSNAVAVAGKFVEALSSAPVTEVEKLLESSQDGHLGLLGHGDLFGGFQYFLFSSLLGEMIKFD